MHYDDSVWDTTESGFYMGFWQTPRYFDEYYDELKREFTRKDNLSTEAINYQTRIREGISVALHIRRTDYVRREGNATLKFDFYEEALRRIQSQLGDFQLFVFTDDKKFVKENFRLREYVLVDGVCDLDEFELMRQCDHHIIANSTFSWWAAYLGESKGGVVYAPCTGIWSEEFYPKGWDLIDTKVEDLGKEY